MMAFFFNGLVVQRIEWDPDSYRGKLLIQALPIAIGIGEATETNGAIRRLIVPFYFIIINNFKLFYIYNTYGKALTIDTLQHSK